jgi:hypothetical protein
VSSEENGTHTPGSEREALEGFLDAQREAIIRKIEGLDDATARKAPTASALSLLGIVKHCALWERRWLIEETARHAGHADIIRETLDGSRGL